MIEARTAGVDTPRIFDLDLVNCTLIIQYLPFPSLKEVLSEMSPDPGSRSDHRSGDLSAVSNLVREAGRCIGLLHAHDLIHGDLTTSNILVDPGGGGNDSNGSLWFIDFGLAEKTDEIENKGVDLHVFTEAFESTHSSLLDLLDVFYEGYREGNPEEGEGVVTRAHEIAKRGRYS